MISICISDMAFALYLSVLVQPGIKFKVIKNYKNFHFFYPACHQALTKEDMQISWTRHSVDVNGPKWLVHSCPLLHGTISWVRVWESQSLTLVLKTFTFSGLFLERLYAIKRPFDFRISSQRHRLLAFLFGWLLFLDMQVSLAPTHVSLLVRP